MDTVKQAIDASYNAHISGLYQILAQSVLAAAGDNNEITAAKERFKKGLQHAEEVRQLALDAAS